MTLTEFLNARLDDDMAWASAEAVRPHQFPYGVAPTGRDESLFTPARMLAEVETKRLIIALAYEATGLDMDKDLDRAVDAREESGVAFVGERMLQALALPYADHPDFNEAWRG